MMKHRGLMLSLGVGCLIVAALLYMFGIISAGPESEVIYFVSKTSSENSTFWHSVERGVKVAGDELGVDIVFVGPEREINLEDQIAYVREGIERKAMAIVLAASDFNALSEVAEEVIDEGITFIAVDSDVNIDDNHSFVATDNVAAAEYLGEEMARSLNKKGLVAIVSHLEGTTSAIDREAGFRKALSRYDDMKLIDEVPYSKNDSEIAYEKTLSLIESYPDVKGIFGTNEATLIGIARAVDELGKKEAITVVGFDISEEAAGYLEKDVISTIVIQRPFNMGYLGIKEAYEQAKYKKEPTFIDVPIVPVTKETMFDEEIQKFLIPFLE